MTSKADVEKLNVQYRGQIIRSGVAVDAAFRRNGELAVALEKVLSGEMDHDEAHAILANNQPNGQSRYIVIANIVDAAVDHANGDETAMARLDTAAVALRDYDAEKILMFRSSSSSDGGERAPRTKRETIGEDVAVAAIKKVAASLGQSAISMRDFNDNHDEYTATDLIAACGVKWSDVQRAAGLEVTKRGRKPKAKPLADAA